jgi:hypothetical protein
MWHDFLVALALVMVIEGILPFLSPDGMRRVMKASLELNDRSLRVGGLVSMLIGVVMLYLVN